VRLKIEIWWLTYKNAVRLRVKWPLLHARREMACSFWLWVYRKTPLWWKCCNGRCLHSRLYWWVERNADMADTTVGLIDDMRRNDPRYVPRYEKRFQQRRAMWGDA